MKQAHFGGMFITVCVELGMFERDLKTTITVWCTWKWLFYVVISWREALQLPHLGECNHSTANDSKGTVDYIIRTIHAHDCSQVFVTRQSHYFDFTRCCLPPGTFVQNPLVEDARRWNGPESRGGKAYRSCVGSYSGLNTFPDSPRVSVLMTDAAVVCVCRGTASRNTALLFYLCFPPLLLTVSPFYHTTKIAL